MLPLFVVVIFNFTDTRRMQEQRKTKLNYNFFLLKSFSIILTRSVFVQSWINEILCGRDCDIYRYIAHKSLKWGFTGCIGNSPQKSTAELLLILMGAELIPCSATRIRKLSRLYHNTATLWHDIEQNRHCFCDMPLTSVTGMPYVTNANASSYTWVYKSLSILSLYVIISGKLCPFYSCEDYKVLKDDAKLLFHYSSDS